MVASASPCLSLANILTYPGADYKQKVSECQYVLGDVDAEAARLMGQFAESIKGLESWQLEELFTRTFDINPSCALEIGWHLYGESYERGNFLVRMRQEMNRLGIPDSGELPDHLTNVLAVLDCLEPAETSVVAEEFALPALQKMLNSIEGKDYPYSDVLNAVFLVLKRLS